LCYHVYGEIKIITEACSRQGAIQIHIYLTFTLPLELKTYLFAGHTKR